MSIGSGMVTWYSWWLAVSWIESAVEKYNAVMMGFSIMALVLYWVLPIMTTLNIMTMIKPACKKIYGLYRHVCIRHTVCPCWICTISWSISNLDQLINQPNVRILKPWFSSLVKVPLPGPLVRRNRGPVISHKRARSDEFVTVSSLTQLGLISLPSCSLIEI